MKSVFWTVALLTVACTAVSFAAQSYTLTKYDDSMFAKACYADTVLWQNHFDGAVTVGTWGICGYSDRIDRVGPGSVLHNSSLYRNVGAAWKFYHKGNGYFTVAELEEIGVPADVAQQLYARFTADICFRGDVPGTKWYCAKQ